MKITLYWSKRSNRIFYTRNQTVYEINGKLAHINYKWLMGDVYIKIHKIGEI